MNEVVIVSACRTAIGVFGGSLRDMNYAALGSIVMKEAVRRAGIDAASVDDVRFGCCMEPVDALECHPHRFPHGRDPGDRHGRHGKPGLHFGYGGRRLRTGYDPRRHG